ncbi:hypothetical protein GQX74_015366 [Glossina fuscipes]|nr:hypothetical protein GQX74_015366 [Glossina fuscipes]
MFFLECLSYRILSEHENHLKYTNSEMSEMESGKLAHNIKVRLRDMCEKRKSVLIGLWRIVRVIFDNDELVNAYKRLIRSWAVSTVMTRENLIPRTKQDTEDELIAALIPFWDMANHRHGHITSYFNMETCQMESTAQDDFNEGEQIFIHYGDRSNAELLIHNGFINSVNPKDSIAIKLGLSQSDPLYEKRSQLLQLLNIPKNGELKVLPAPEHISPELLAFVRVFNMNEEQLQHWICSERATDLLHIDCALETSLESKTWQYLQTRLMLLLRVFPTTLEADETQLAGVKCGKLQMAQIPVMILEYRILEKRILAAALDYAKQRTKA